MVHQVTGFSDAFLAWEQWNLTNFDYKCEQLLSLKAQLSEVLPSLAPVMSFHIQQASTLLAESHQLIGPTGETNELYTAGRGVAALVFEQDFNGDTTAQQAIIAQFTAALIAGNSVMLCSDDMALNQGIQTAIEQSRFPNNLIQVVSYDAYHQLLACDVRSVGYVGNSKIEHSINLQLAKREGAIVNLVSQVLVSNHLASEKDLATLTVAHDPHLSLRFITERTRTINITAVGGNATLLELGSDAH